MSPYQFRRVTDQPPDKVLECGCFIQYGRDDVDCNTTDVIPCRQDCETYQQIYAYMQAAAQSPGAELERLELP